MSRSGLGPLPRKNSCHALARNRFRFPSGVKVNVSAPTPSRCRAPRASCGSRCRRASSSRSRTRTLVAKTERDDHELAKFHGLARSLVANAVAGVTDGLQEGARHRRRRLPRGGEGQADQVRPRLLASGGVRHPRGDRRRHRQADARDGHRHRPAARGPGGRGHPPLRKPDPYKQKGVRYTGEVLKKKVGKTGAQVAPSRTRRLARVQRAWTV